MGASAGCGSSADRPSRSRLEPAAMRLTSDTIHDTARDAAVGALNGLPADTAVRAFLRCCGSMRWAQAMAEARPFVSAAALVDAADRIWAGLNAADWLEAFAAHPRIGDTSAEPSPGPRETPVARASANAHQEWSSGEQSGVRDASAGLRLRLAEV